MDIAKEFVVSEWKLMGTPSGLEKLKIIGHDFESMNFYGAQAYGLNILEAVELIETMAEALAYQILHPVTDPSQDIKNDKIAAEALNLFKEWE